MSLKNFEKKEDCPPVEKFIWDKVAKSYGYFEGVHELSLGELGHLETLILQQKTRIIQQSTLVD